MEIRASFYEQMLVLEENILRNPQYRFRFPDPGEEIKKEEQMVSNTFENSRAFLTSQKFTIVPGFSESLARKKAKCIIKWADETKRTEKLAVEIVDGPLRARVVSLEAKGPKYSSLKSAEGKGKKAQRCPASSERDEKNVSTTSSASSASDNQRNSMKGLPKKDE